MRNYYIDKQGSIIKFKDDFKENVYEKEKWIFKSEDTQVYK